MQTDLLTLLHRDHTDLRDELTLLLDPAATTAEVRIALDGVRLGLFAHAEAENIVLGRFERLPALEGPIAQARGAHLTQEGALSALVSARPRTMRWRERARHLRALVHHHAAEEARGLLPALRHHIPMADYARLAGAFATERLCQLAMLQPSAPIYVPSLPEAHGS
jgi:hypothetical protein